MISKRAAISVLAAIVASAPAHAAVMISTAATQNMTCSGGVCAPTARKAVLNVGDLENLLASGNAEVTTTGSGVEAKDIVVKAMLSWSSHNTLSLFAHRSIVVVSPVSVAGAGGLSLTANATNGGTLSFGSKGSIGFTNLSSVLTINGAAFTLVSNISSLASDIASNPAGAYALANNCDASQDGTYRTAPVATTLTGTAEGLGNTISNLSIESTRGGGYFGLFAQTSNTGTVESVRMTGVKIRVRGKNRGGVVGSVAGWNRGLMFDDRATGDLSAQYLDVGGLAGANFGTVTLSSAKVRVSVHKPNAGLAVTGGGLVADNAGTISLSHAGGDVNGGPNAIDIAGGLVGNNDNGTISESYATGFVTGGDQSKVGGLAGISQNSGGITNSYATGAVTGGADAEVGGLIGENDNTAEDSYSTGAVSGGTGSLVGGFVGSGHGTFATNYWDTTTSGTDEGAGGTNIDGVTGLTTEQFQSGLPAGFDPAIWNEKATLLDGLPYLIANLPPK